MVRDREDVQLSGRNSGQVWLPNAQVWARVPTRPLTEDRATITEGSKNDHRSNINLTNGAESSSMNSGPAQTKQRSNSSQEHAAVLETSPLGEPAARASYTFFGLAEQPLDLPQEPLSEVELISDEDSEGGLPVCPICLGEIFDLRDKAVVISCMHVFCLACLSRWSSLKKSCPLCKSRIQGYMYNILSETDYQERLLPPTPPRAKTPLSPGPTSLPLGQHPEQQRAGSEQWRGTPLIDACPPGGGASWREAHRSRSRDGRASVFRRGRQQAGEWVPGMWPPVRVEPPASSRASQRRSPLREPRPYFYRVQAQAQSQVQGGPLAGRGGICTSEGVPLQQDAAEAWRRHVYVEGLRAQPMDEAAVGGAPAMSEERREARLSAWVDRELRAVLQADDVAIVRAYVMGLVRGVGFSAASGRASAGNAPGGTAAQGRADGRGGEHKDAVAALRPFLQEHAEHFWHELRCFAKVPLSMQTYDRLVKYHTRPGASGSSPAAGGVPSTESSATTAAAVEQHSRSRPRASADPSRGGDRARLAGGSSSRSPEHRRRRRRRRFSSRPPEDSGSEAARSQRADGPDTPADDTSTQQKHRRGRGERESCSCRAEQGRRGGDRMERASRADNTAADVEGDGQRLAGAPGAERQGRAALRGEDELAGLRARALAALQARRQAAEHGRF